MTETTGSAIMFAENGESIAGEAHLSSLRIYMNRLAGLVSLMRPYSVCPLAEFGPDEQDRCSKLLRLANVMQGVLGSITDITEPVFDSLSTPQRLELTDLMNHLEGWNMKAVVLVIELNKVLATLTGAEPVVLPEGGGGQV